MRIHLVDSDELLDNIGLVRFACCCLYADDELGREAAVQFNKLAEESFHHNLRFLACLIREEEDARLLQVIKLPQFRFFKQGNEEEAIVGVTSVEELEPQLRKLLGR
jgi:hypothetical protein